MQVINNTAKYNTNFEALKSIKFKNDYRKKPELQLKLLNAIDSNSALKKTYKNYDTNIIFHSYKNKNEYFSEVEIWCDKPRYSRFERLKQLVSFGYLIRINTNDTISESLDESTDNLVEKIKNSSKKIKKDQECLDKIFAKDENMQKTNSNYEDDVQVQVLKKINSMIYK